MSVQTQRMHRTTPCGSSLSSHHCGMRRIITTVEMLSINPPVSSVDLGEIQPRNQSLHSWIVADVVQERIDLRHLRICVLVKQSGKGFETTVLIAKRKIERLQLLLVRIYFFGDV